MSYRIKSFQKENQQREKYPTLTAAFMGRQVQVCTIHTLTGSLCFFSSVGDIVSDVNE